MNLKELCSAEVLRTDNLVEEIRPEVLAKKEFEYGESSLLVENFHFSPYQFWVAAATSRIMYILNDKSKNRKLPKGSLM